MEIHIISKKEQYWNLITNLINFMSLASDPFSRSIVSTTIPIEDLKFVYSVPQIVDPDPLTCIVE